MHWLRLFLRVLKSPLYVSVIFGGMLPLEMSSTYFAATLSGIMTASSVSLMPPTMSLKEPENFFASARVARRPALAASTSIITSWFTDSRFFFTLSMAFVIRAFLPGKRSMSTERSPCAYLVTISTTFIFTAMCDWTSVLIPLAI